MKLSQLASKPQLIKITLDDETLVKEFGEAIEFWTWDRQPLDVFMRLANAKESDVSSMIDIVRTLILNEDGTQIVTDGAMLPTNVLIAAIGSITTTLGK
jgi:hypothetical protein